MRTLSAPVLTALAQPTVPLASLSDMALSAPFRVNTSSWQLTWGGNTYDGMGRAGRIEVIEDSVGELNGLRFQLSGVPSDLIALALAEPLQGKPISIYTAIFDRNNYQILDAVLEWAGLLDKPDIVEDGDTCTIQCTAEHVGLDLLRPSNVRYSNADQQALFPGDRGFEYVIDQDEKPIIWPARSFFRV